MKTSPPSAYTSSPMRSGRSKIVSGLAMTVLSLGLALSAWAQADQGFTEEDNRVRGNPQAPLHAFGIFRFHVWVLRKVFPGNLADPVFRIH